MEWSVMFMGPVGSGKTTAVRTISDIEVVSTDARATDDVLTMKSHTTVAMDVGVLALGDKDKLRIYGTPGQDRFDFMWDILLNQSKGVLLVVNHAADDAVAQLDHYYRDLAARQGERNLPIVVCVSHMDAKPDVPLDIYHRYFRETVGLDAENVPPILSMDARDKSQVRAALVAMTALLEMVERFPKPMPIKRA
ncbi:GTP-binding protein [Diaphorobacter aerolatus]|uniref:ATP/GTP-binding protein n=1 Tax=Diaphorobacter aerolatus TaxID=1288495 RepID=A0A7H0GLZ5_9BURK|nr:ATP/GTP-binding protein [Diaphorobacter aerolatus]QNP49311.1 ATP/GTP-binding protein [Diaphorobacter aerolatus]